MKAVHLMIGASIGSWLAAAALTGMRGSVDILAGMLGPLAAVTSTWLMTERTYRRHPERLTALMITAFAGKMVFFGAYVAIALMVFRLRPVLFVASFISYFIGLYLIEALYLRRLFASGTA
jgi:hypothetical protein